jgi:membrane-bound acyltransferase YfiQ involved in biofilm formation
MILFLRDEKNRSIVDIEFYIKHEGDFKDFIELHSVVCIESYSYFLLENLDKKDKIIETFDFISELRGWLWESYFMGKQNDVKEYDNVLKLLRNFMHEWAKEFNLKYVED